MTAKLMDLELFSDRKAMKSNSPLLMELKPNAEEPAVMEITKQGMRFYADGGDQRSKLTLKPLESSEAEAGFILLYEGDELFVKAVKQQILVNRRFIHDNEAMSLQHGLSFK
jgi:hypothetical protein